MIEYVGRRLYSMEIGPACKSHSSTRTLFSASVARICATNKAVVVAPLPAFAGWNANTGAFFLPPHGLQRLEDRRAKFFRTAGNGAHRKAAESALENVCPLATGGYAQDSGGRLNAAYVVFDSMRGRFIIGAQKYQLGRKRIQQAHAFVGLRIALQATKDTDILRECAELLKSAKLFRGPCRKSVPSAFEKWAPLDQCGSIPVAR